MSLIDESLRYSSSLKTGRRGVSPPAVLKLAGQPSAMTMGGVRDVSSGAVRSAVAADAHAALVAMALVPSDSGISYLARQWG